MQLWGEAQFRDFALREMLGVAVLSGIGSAGWQAGAGRQPANRLSNLTSRGLSSVIAKKPPVGPAESKRAILIAVAAPSSGVRTPVLSLRLVPTQHHAKLHSTNPLERFNGEVKRRTDVVGIFP